MSVRPVSVDVTLDDDAADDGALDPAREDPKTGRHARLPVTVVVQGCYQVSHAGQIYGPGETIEVPADVAERWQRSGYVL